MDGLTKLYDAGHVGHFHFAFNQPLAQLLDILGQVEAAHLLDQLVLVAVVDHLAFSDEGRVFLEAAVQFVQVFVILRSVIFEGKNKNDSTATISIRYFFFKTDEFKENKGRIIKGRDLTCFAMLLH